MDVEGALSEITEAALSGAKFGDPQPLQLAVATIFRGEVGNGGFAQLLWNERALHRAGKGQSEDTIKALKAVSAKDALTRYRKALKRLNADKKERNAFFAASFFEDEGQLRKDLYALTDGFDYGALDAAIASYVGAYRDKCVKSFQPRLRAAEHGFRSLVEAVLDEGVDVNHKDQFGASVLIGAIRSRSAPMVRLVTERGADVYWMDRGRPTNAWSTLSYNPNPKVADVLIEAFARVDGMSAADAAQKGWEAADYHRKNLGRSAAVKELVAHLAHRAEGATPTPKKKRS